MVHVAGRGRALEVLLSGEDIPCVRSGGALCVAQHLNRV